MKIKGIIPELKMSKRLPALLPLQKFEDMLQPYKIISINTSSLFEGTITNLERAKKVFPKKFIIRKDFIMIPRQIKESKEAGADAVLILYEFLKYGQYKELIKACKKYKIVPIVEISKLGHCIDPNYEHSKLHSILSEGHVTILVNSRDLNSDGKISKIDKGYAEWVCKRLKENGIKNFIYASGEKSDRVVKKGIADAVLIGTTFMNGKLI